MNDELMILTKVWVIPHPAFERKEKKDLLRLLQIAELCTLQLSALLRNNYI